MVLSMCISVWKYPLADDSLTDQTFVGGEEYLVTIDRYSWTSPKNVGDINQIGNVTNIYIPSALVT